MSRQNGNRRDPLGGIVPDLGTLRGASNGRVQAQIVHDPGNLQGLVRLHDVHLFLEASRRYRPDAAVAGDAIRGGDYESFAAAATEVLDDLAEFGSAVGAWNAAHTESPEEETVSVGDVADGES